ncbi:hypothetical protein BDV09DRAFT_198905 [Aspergillus tetrazonus]
MSPRQRPWCWISNLHALREVPSGVSTSRDEVEIPSHCACRSVIPSLFFSFLVILLWLLTGYAVQPVDRRSKLCTAGSDAESAELNSPPDISPRGPISSYFRSSSASNSPAEAPANANISVTPSRNHLPWAHLNLREACLLRYFVEDLSRWFDLTDPRNYFATCIPQRARSNSTLLDAILAVSARHFSTLSTAQKARILHLYLYGLTDTQIRGSNLNITEETVIHYHSRCIAELRVLASEPQAVMDENLLAAVVVLRFFEELDNPFTSPPTETALQGLHVFLRAQASSALSYPGPGVRQAAFWVGFRQEFNLAFSQQRTTNLPLEVSRKYLTISEAEDHVWTNQLIVLGAMVLEFCYGSHTDGAGGDYGELIQLRDEWVAKRSMSFAPVYVESPTPDSETGSIFPGIWYADDTHITAAQTLCLLDILFIAFAPTTPRLGPSRRQELDAIDEKIRKLVLEICGMALSNRQCKPAGGTACIAINLCADRFTDKTEQRELMGLVVGTMRESNYWTMVEGERRLRAAWGWDDVDS